MLHTEAADAGHDQHDHEHHQTAQHVQGVEAGHGEITRRPEVAERDHGRQVHFGMIFKELLVFLVHLINAPAGFRRRDLGEAVL